MKLTDEELTALLARVNELGAAWGTTCGRVEQAIAELRALRATTIASAEQAEHDTAERIAAFCDRMGWDHTADLIRDGAWRSK